jgi:hypothetical protein
MRNNVLGTSLPAVSSNQHGVKSHLLACDAVSLARAHPDVFIGRSADYMYMSAICNLRLFLKSVLLMACHDVTLLATALFWAVTQRVVVISNRRFGTTCRSHLQEPRIRPLKMGPIGCPETSVRHHHYSLRNIPEKRSSHWLRGGSLKSDVA